MDVQDRIQRSDSFTVSFFALAALVAVDALRSLTGGGGAPHSTLGIVIAALSLVIMPVLSWLQRRAGRELGSRTAVADSKQTLLSVAGIGDHDRRRPRGCLVDHFQARDHLVRGLMVSGIVAFCLRSMLFSVSSFVSAQVSSQASGT